MLRACLESWVWTPAPHRRSLRCPCSLFSPPGCDRVGSRAGLRKSAQNVLTTFPLSNPSTARWPLALFSTTWQCLVCAQQRWRRGESGFFRAGGHQIQAGGCPRPSLVHALRGCRSCTGALPFRNVTLQTHSTGKAEKQAFSGVASDLKLAALV